MAGFHLDLVDDLERWSEEDEDRVEDIEHGTALSESDREKMATVRRCHCPDLS